MARGLIYKTVNLKSDIRNNNRNIIKEKPMLMRIERHPGFGPAFRSIFDFEPDFSDVLTAAINRGLNPSRGSLPAVDVLEQNDATVIVAELPGVAKDQIAISMDKDVLTISGERQPVGVPEGSRWTRSESLRGKFSRSVRLSHPVNAEGISAELTHGLLRVLLPKAEEARPREITIK
jgi:HSP20 family protein